MKFFRTLFALCSHFQNYRDIRDVPVTTSLSFIARLLALLTLVFLLASIPRARELVNNVAQHFDRKRPEFALQDGRVLTAIKEPYTWGDTTLQFVLDPERRIQAPCSNTMNCAVFTSNSIVYWMTLTNAPESIVRSHEASLAGFPNGPVTGDYLRSLARTFLWVLAPFSWLLLTLGSMLLCLLQAYIFSLVASA